MTDIVLQNTLNRVKEQRKMNIEATLLQLYIIVLSHAYYFFTLHVIAYFLGNFENSVH